MERSLLLNQLDTSWKNHLYTMDHLRSAIGLVGYAQEDPKTEYKREGMKEFDAMWEGVEDKVTDIVFRMEEEEGFQESLWSIGADHPRIGPQDRISAQRTVHRRPARGRHRHRANRAKRKKNRSATAAKRSAATIRAPAAADRSIKCAACGRW